MQLRDINFEMHISSSFVNVLSSMHHLEFEPGDSVSFLTVYLQAEYVVVFFYFLHDIENQSGTKLKGGMR